VDREHLHDETMSEADFELYSSSLNTACLSFLYLTNPHVTVRIAYTKEAK